MEEREEKIRKKLQKIETVWLKVLSLKIKISTFIIAMVPLISYAQTLMYEDFPKPEKYLEPSELIHILERGTVVLIHEKIGRPTFVTGIVLINAPFEKVWETITDYESYNKYVPNVEKLSIKEKRYTEDGEIWTVEHKIIFRLVGFLSVGIEYSLDLHLDKKKGEIYGTPSRKGKRVFRNIGHREVFIPVDGNRTIMFYTAYADLSSFGLLAKLIFRALPELEVPTLIIVSAVFPEAIKGRIENIELIKVAKNIDPTKVRVPPRLKDISGLVKILSKYKKAIISFYPDENGIRFASGLAIVSSSEDDVWRVITDFEGYKKFFGMIKEVKKSPERDGKFTVDYRFSYKALFSIDIRYSLDYVWRGRRRLEYRINKERKRDIEDGWGVWDVYPLDTGTLLSYTEFADLRSSNFILRFITDKIQGADIGIRIGLVSTLIDAFGKACSE